MTPLDIDTPWVRLDPVGFYLLRSGRLLKQNYDAASVNEMLGSKSNRHSFLI